MPKTPKVSGEDAVTAFEGAGFRLVRISGSHHILKKDGCRRLSIPVHAGKTVGAGLLLSQIKAAGLTVEECVGLLNS